MGLTIDRPTGWCGGARLHYFGQAPVGDIHFHPVEPRTLRLNPGLSF